MCATIKVGNYLLIMYSVDDLKDTFTHKLIETNTYKNWISDKIKLAEVQNIDELAVFWNDMGMSPTWDEEVINQKIYGMMTEKILIYNPIFENGGYYFPSEIIEIK